jgi:hypothetical protein
MGMRFRIALLAAATVGAAFVGGPAAADLCNGTVTDIGGLYVDDRIATENGIWAYLETNGSAGLQSGGTDLLGLVYDPCGYGFHDQLIATTQPSFVPCMPLCIPLQDFYLASR